MEDKLVKMHKPGDSLFGTTTVWNKKEFYPFPTASRQEDVPQGGLYGAGTFEYSLPKVSTDNEE